MYKLISSIQSRTSFVAQICVLATSFLIAELFYKFHSFTLECLAFLATWYVLDLIVSRAPALIAPKK